MKRSIPWELPFGEKDVNTMLNIVEGVLAAYNGFKTYVPVWYKETGY